MATDRPAHEIDAEDAIEITPKMIEAGIRAIPRWAVDYDEIVELVYVAMERARRLDVSSR